MSVVVGRAEHVHQVRGVRAVEHGSEARRQQCRRSPVPQLGHLGAGRNHPSERAPRDVAWARDAEQSNRLDEVGGRGPFRQHATECSLRLDQMGRQGERSIGLLVTLADRTEEDLTERKAR